MIDFSLKSGACHTYLNYLYTDGKDYNSDIIKNYPFFNYLLRSGTPNNLKYGKFGILLTIFLGIIKKLDTSLVPYFDGFFFQILRELDFTPDGLTIPNMEVNAFKAFLKVFSDLTANQDVQVFSDNLNIPLGPGWEVDTVDILEDIDVLLEHVIIQYNVEQIMKRTSAISRINIHEINKILFIKYFPRTLILASDFEIIPGGFLINCPSRMYHYGMSLLHICEDEDLKRILGLELKIFKIKFFLRKDYLKGFEPELILDKINMRNCPYPLRVNDTISVLHDYFSTDIDLEHWTGARVAEERKLTDVMVYYDYLRGKVRHQAYNQAIDKALKFFKCDTNRKNDYLVIQSDRIGKESFLNELIYKNILL